MSGHVNFNLDHMILMFTLREDLHMFLCVFVYVFNGRKKPEERS
jgi:hypothetical protein